jgi:hypothetical protein
MTPSRTTKRLTSGAPGMKALITATSLAVTLGGWAMLALEQSETAPSAAETLAVESAAIQPMASSFELSLAPIPTIAAPPAPPKIVVNNPPVADVKPAAHGSIQAAARQAAAPAAAPEAAPAAAPQPAPAAPLPPLRAVSAPPKPVARTHSSR